MASRRDQLQSYQFMVQRVLSAFVMRETDPAQSPLRRGIGAVFAGIMVAVVVAAGFGVYGLLTKIGRSDWKKDGSVVVERETGASFVYLSGKVHPTLNLTSALLAGRQPSATVHRVARKALSAVPRGLTLGIAGAPDSLPPANRRVGMPWTLCSAASTGSSGNLVTTVSLVAGSAPANARNVNADQAVLVKDAGNGNFFLIAQSHRYPLNEPDVVIPALFGAVVTPVTVGTAWLNTLPGGAVIGPISIPQRGNPSPGVPGRKIGDLLEAPTAAGPQHYLVFDDGLAPITPLQKAIFVAQSQAPQVAQTTVSDATRAKQSTRLGGRGDEFAPPLSPPKLAQPASGNDLICATARDAKSDPVISTGGTVARIEAGVPTGSRSPDGTVLADRVTVPSGSVAVVRVLASPSATTGAYYIVTDSGIRYAVPSDDILPILGYSAQTAVDVPAGLINRIPTGPVLDPNAALLPVVLQQQPAPQRSGG